MSVAAILVMWPGPFEQTFVPPSHGDSTWNLTLIGQAVSEGKIFRVWTTTSAYTISSPNEPKDSGELIKSHTKTEREQNIHIRIVGFINDKPIAYNVQRKPFAQYHTRL